jgi:hypothetical protein
MAHRWDPRCTRPTGLVKPSPLDPDGEIGPTRDQAAGPLWRQTSWGLYVPSDVDGSVVEQRIVEQAGRIRGYGAVTGWSALRWHGATFFDGTADGGRTELPVSLVVHSKLRPDPRSTYTEEQLSCFEWSWVGGLPVTTVQRALFDEVRRIDSVREKACAISMAAAARLISTQLFATYVAHRGPWTGIQGARDAVRLAVDDCRSPQEFRMLMVWLLDADLPMPLLNREVFDLDGNLIGIPDLLDVEAGCAGEYQGEDHKDGQRHREDVEREERFRDHGLELFEVVGGDLRQRQKVVERMHKARSRSKFLPPESRAWTLEPPPWRPRPESVHEYLVRKGLADQLWRS